MKISARVIEHSIAPHGGELVTFEVEAPERIHKEVVRHRAFSFSILSTRVTRFTTMLKMVQEDPYIPTIWMADCREMQPCIELAPSLREDALQCWMRARDMAVEEAKALHEIGVHKGDVTPLLSPFLYFKGLLTATDRFINHFFAMRMHRKAKVEFQILAKRMAEALRDSSPDERGFGMKPLTAQDWHLPFILPEERESGEDPTVLAQYSAARCARLSIARKGEKVPNIEADRDLFLRLVDGDNVEASPTEHQAFPHWRRHHRSRNYEGFVQYRELVPRETQYDYDWRQRLEDLGDRDYEI